MRKLGVIFIIVAVVIGFISDKCISTDWLEYFIGLAFCFFLSGIYALILDKNCPNKGSMPHYENPPPPPKKCVGITPHGRIYRPEFQKDRKKCIY